MTVSGWLALIALILVVASFVVKGFPLLAVAVILLSVAVLVGGVSDRHIP